MLQYVLAEVGLLEKPIPVKVLNNKIEYPAECTALNIFSLYLLCKSNPSVTIVKTNNNSLGTTIRINLNYEQISILIKIGLSSLGFLVYRLKTEDEIIF